jgi:hypothetical protein
MNLSKRKDADWRTLIWAYFNDEILSTKWYPIIAFILISLGSEIFYKAYVGYQSK